LIQLRKIDSDEIFQFNLDGNSPSFIDMPIWFTHNIKNIGKDDLITLFWINEPYDIDSPDTYLEKV
jgi:UDP-2-acetamido-2,6-beta-L-arabino-hexul-4-ose reductase